MKCCWRSLAMEDIFVPRVMPNEWPPSPTGWPPPTLQPKAYRLLSAIHSMVPPRIPSTLPIAKLVDARGLSSSKKSIWCPHWFVPSAVAR